MEIEDINNKGQEKSKQTSEEKNYFYKTNPYKNPKFLAKIAALALLGPLGWVPLEGGTVTLSQSSLGNLIFLILLITGLVKIALKNPQGWVWFASFFYYGAFAHAGVVAWLYMLLTGLGLYVHNRWCREQ